MSRRASRNTGSDPGASYGFPATCSTAIVQTVVVAESWIPFPASRLIAISKHSASSPPDARNRSPAWSPIRASPKPAASGPSGPSYSVRPSNAVHDPATPDPMSAVLTVIPEQVAQTTVIVVGARARERVTDGQSRLVADEPSGPDRLARHQAAE
jgi:hypothetical protein